MISLRFVLSSPGHWAEALWTQNDPPSFKSQIFLIEASALALWTQALGDGFHPPALAICSQAVIYGRRIISLDNRSHYHLELESLVSARFLFLSSSRVLLSCGPSVVVGQVTALSHRLHRCINFTSSEWYQGVKVRAAHCAVEIMVVSRSRVTAVLPPLIRLN